MDITSYRGATITGTKAPEGGSAPTKSQPKIDGRRERSASSRRGILNAMVQLIEAGDPSPTAEKVAATAGVSLRTVFRHFEEMENLHLEIAAIVFERVRPILQRPFTASQWPESLEETATRRAEFFEAIAPFKTAMDVLRHRSKAIETQYRRITAMSRDLLLTMLPAQIANDKARFELMCLMLSIETWQRLREQQGLSIGEARSTVLHGARVIAGLDA